MSDKNKLLNCYMDLQRASVASYRNPKGNNHLVFLKHAVGILKSIKSEKYNSFYKKLLKISEMRIKNKEHYSDKILTIGLLLKP